MVMRMMVMRMMRLVGDAPTPAAASDDMTCGKIAVGGTEDRCGSVRMHSIAQNTTSVGTTRSDSEAAQTRKKFKGLCISMPGAGENNGRYRP